ncbi:hypothetical protein [Acholeplasma granularum]|uniref:hypothetical protein n=1 Tax=Acholeplasma granularum TaxID=264635 RepID=UPI0004710CD5|nr:hypothetical protein [Acholeplasma granularum]
MNDFIINNIETITVIGFIFTFIFLIVIISLIRYLYELFTENKFIIVASSNIVSGELEKQFMVRIFNKNMNDIRISSLGFSYKENNIDFFNQYLEDNKLSNNHKVVVLSRDYITLNIHTNKLKNVILDINKGKMKVSKLDVYVTDALGITTKIKAKEIRKIILRMIKESHKLKQIELKIEKDKLKKENKTEKQRNKIEKKIIRKEKLSKVIFKLKNLFKSKK